MGRLVVPNNFQKHANPRGFGEFSLLPASRRDNSRIAQHFNAGSACSWAKSRRDGCHPGRSSVPPGLRTTPDPDPALKRLGYSHLVPPGRLATREVTPIPDSGTMRGCECRQNARGGWSGRLVLPLLRLGWGSLGNRWPTLPIRFGPITGPTQRTLALPLPSYTPRPGPPGAARRASSPSPAHGTVEGGWGVRGYPGRCAVSEREIPRLRSQARFTRDDRGM